VEQEMSGNVEINRSMGSPIQVNHRSTWTLSLITLVDELNNLGGIWGSKCRYDQSMFMGSTRVFMEHGVPTSFLRLYKPSLGDIDIMIPNNMSLDALTKLIESSDLAAEIGSEVADLVVVGTKKVGQNLSVIVHHRLLGQNAQIDFCPKQFDGMNNPTPFARWSTTTAVEDIKWGLKGTIRNLLVSAITRANGSDNRTHLFSPFNGLKSLETNTYITREETFARSLFGNEDIRFADLSSFHDVCTQIRLNFSEQQSDHIADAFVKMMKEPKPITNDSLEDQLMRHKALTLFGLLV
jgi:hypothetical protein